MLLSAILPGSTCSATGNTRAAGGNSRKDVKWDLTKYGGRDQASSYANNTGCTVTISNYRAGPDATFTIKPHTRSPYMPEGWNNVADWVKVC